LKHIFLILCSAVVVFSCSCIKANNAKPVLVIMADKGFYEPEYTVPREALEKKGYKIEVANLSGETSVGFGGLEVKVDLAIKDAREENYHSVLLVGGTGAMSLYDNQDLIQLVQAFHKSGKLIGAQCYSSVILGQAGLLKGERATTWDDAGKKLQSYGVIYTGEILELSKYILTARAGTPETNIEKFSQAYIDLLKNKNYAIP
jgi:protease I